MADIFKFKVFFGGSPEAIKTLKYRIRSEYKPIDFKKIIPVPEEYDMPEYFFDVDPDFVKDAIEWVQIKKSGISSFKECILPFCVEKWYVSFNNLTAFGEDLISNGGYSKYLDCYNWRMENWGGICVPRSEWEFNNLSFYTQGYPLPLFVELASQYRFVNFRAIYRQRGQCKNSGSIFGVNGTVRDVPQGYMIDAIRDALENDLRYDPFYIFTGENKYGF